MKISVVIPLYNKELFILETIRSVHIQTFQPFEVIIINDGSTDSSEEIIKNINYTLIRFVNQSNQGVSIARNRGIKEAKGDWIAFLDADDIWLPEYLENIKVLFDKFPQCKVLASAYMIQDKSGVRKKTVLTRMPFCLEDGKLSNYFEVSIYSHPPIWTSATVVNRDAIMKIGGFPPGIISGEDLLTWAKLAVEFEIAYSKKALAVFVNNDQHTYNGYPSRIPQEPDIVGKELIALARKHSEIPGLKSYVSLWFKMRSSVYLRLGMKRKAFTEIIRSLFFNPMNLKVYVYLFFMPLTQQYINKLFRRFGQG